MFAAMATDQASNPTQSFLVIPIGQFMFMVVLIITISVMSVELSGCTVD